MASKSETARQELLALAEEWTTPGTTEALAGREARYWAREECADGLRRAVDRLFPVKPSAEPEPDETHPIVTFPVLGGGVYGVGEAKIAELAKLYEVPVPYLLDQLGIVAAKLQAGALAKKTRRGMPKALFNWSAVAKRIYETHARHTIAQAPSSPPANGKPRVALMGGETVVIYRGQTYRQSQWPAEYGPWPGGA